MDEKAARSGELTHYQQGHDLSDSSTNWHGMYMLRSNSTLPSPPVDIAVGSVSSFGIGRVLAPALLILANKVKIRYYD